MPCFSLLSLSTAPQYTTLYQPDSFSTQHEKRFGTVWTATAQNWNKLFTRIEHSTMQSGWPRRSGALDLSSHLWISTSVSVGTSPSSYSFTSATEIDIRRNSRSLSDMWRSTSEIGAAQLRSFTEIAPKTPFLFMNRSSIRYGFIVCVRAIQYNVNIT